VQGLVPLKPNEASSRSEGPAPKDKKNPTVEKDKDSTWEVTASASTYRASRSDLPLHYKPVLYEWPWYQLGFLAFYSGIQIFEQITVYVYQAVRFSNLSTESFHLLLRG
jgi:hypothetical protein